MTEPNSETTLILGGTGFIGRALCAALLRDHKDEQFVVLTRSPQCRRHRRIQFIGSLNELAVAPKRIINLAGAPIADKRWSDSRKTLLRDSRVAFTQDLLEFCQKEKWHPDLLVNASAIGFYGAENVYCDEETAKGTGFAADLCHDWEGVAQGFNDLGTRVCILRLGVVLGQGGGALSALLPMYKFGLGGPIGSGEQGFSWVQLEDVVRAIEWCLDNSALSGVFNMTAPELVSQAEFATTLASVLHRPSFMPTPTAVLKLIFGQMAEELLIGGQFVKPQKLLDLNFPYNYPDLRSALMASI